MMKRAGRWLLRRGPAVEAPVPLSAVHIIIAMLVIALAAFARFFRLDSLPPGLWYDEALYSLDAVAVLRGNFPLFFDEHGHPREPMFPYLLAVAFKLFEPSVFAARAVSAIFGTLAVALFFPVARRVLGNNWALVAMAAFAAFRWPLHFSRTIFRAGLSIPFALAGIWLFLRWREKRRPVDAALCGIVVGASLYTYIAMRVMPLLVIAALSWMTWRREIGRKDVRQLALMAAATLMVVAPLGIDYIRHPDHLSGRTSEISMFEKTVKAKTPPYADVRVAKTLHEAVAGLADNVGKIAMMWTIKGDHVARHNLPYRPVFDWLSGTFFFIGVAIAISTARRKMLSFLLLAWLIGFCAASIFSFGAPNLLRTQAAAPAAIILMILGLRAVVESLFCTSAVARYIVAGACVLFFGANQLYDYFIRFARHPQVRQEFLADIFYAPAESARQLSQRVLTMYLPAELSANLTTRFVLSNSTNISYYNEREPLPFISFEAKGPMPTNRTIGYLLTGRSLQLAAESQVDHLNQVQTMPTSVMLRRLPMSPDPGAPTWAWLYTARSN